MSQNLSSAAVVIDTLTVKYQILYITPGRRQSKTSILSTNIDKKSLETESSIAICRPT